MSTPRTHAESPAPGYATASERDSLGRQARERVPRHTHGVWEPPGDRPDPIALLEEQAATRVAELLPIRYGRMASSAFSFFRGGAAIMASDLAGSPDSGFVVQICGDAHLANFGVYSAPDRSTVFDLNDFDETLPGPWEWDVKRLAASFEILGRERGFSEKQSAEAVRAVVRVYRESMRGFAEQGNLAVWYSRMDVAPLLKELRERAKRKQLRQTERALQKARDKSSYRAIAKLTHLVDGERRFVSDPPLVVPLSELFPAAKAEEIERGQRAALASYRQSLPADRQHLLDSYRFVDLARKVVGVGSVGAQSWAMLLVGRDDTDPLVLQIKQAQASVLEPYLGSNSFENHGQRVVEGQRLMQATSDVLLGWLRARGVDGRERDHYVRQLWDGKGSADTERMTPESMAIYARMCGWTLARAHARAGDRIAVAAYLGGGTEFEDALAVFARHYANQNERDYRSLLDAIENGRLEATTDV